MTGLSPAIAIEQRTTVAHPRSTVGTVTEIYDHLRVLFATLGKPHCPRCGEPIAAQSADEMAARLLEQSPGAVAVVAAPVARGPQGRLPQGARRRARRGPPARAHRRPRGRASADRSPLDPRRGHRIDVLVDRLALRPGSGGAAAREPRRRPSTSRGASCWSRSRASGERLLSQQLACARCDVSVPELSPRAFSFNSAHGACPACDGLGQRWAVDPARVMPDETRSVLDGAIRPWHRHGPRLLREALFEVAERHGFSLEVPGRRAAGRGAARSSSSATTDGFPGVVPYLRRRVDEPPAARPLARRRGGPRRRRGVRGPAALPDRGGVPGLPGHAPAAREPRRAGGGALRGRPRAPAARRAPARRPPRLAFGERERPVGERLVGGDPLPAATCCVSLGLGYLALDRATTTLSGRRGPPPAPRHPDRRPDAGAPLRPRRAVGGPAPARQRAAHRDPRLHPRRGEHGGGGRARRGDDPRRRLGDRPRRGRGRPRRPPHVRGPARRRSTGASPAATSAASSRSRCPRRAGRPAGWLRVLGARAQQPARRRRLDPPRRAHRGDRRLGLGQVDAGRGRAAPRARPAALPGHAPSPAATGRSRARRRSTR